MSVLSGLKRFLTCFPARSSSVAGTTISDPNDEDIIGCLPHDVFSMIVSLLPIKDATRTAVLSSRWRDLWASNPLVLNDIDLLLNKPSHVGAVIASISDAITAHPGPFRSVKLTCYFSDTDERILRHWIRVLASKGVAELVFNIPWAGLDLLPVPSSSAARCSASGSRSGARFPDTSGAAFHLLQTPIAATTVDLCVKFVHQLVKFEGGRSLRRGRPGTWWIGGDGSCGAVDRRCRHPAVTFQRSKIGEGKDKMTWHGGTYEFGRRIGKLL
jgi:hypothetical protein